MYIGISNMKISSQLFGDSNNWQLGGGTNGATHTHFDVVIALKIDFKIIFFNPS